MGRGVHSVFFRGISPLIKTVDEFMHRGSLEKVAHGEVYIFYSYAIF